MPSRYKSSQFSDDGISIANQEAEAIARDSERKDDEAYQRDFAALVAIFRSNIAGKEKPNNIQFGVELARLRYLVIDGWGASDAQFPQQCFDDHGPAILLRALAKAYEQPAHVMGELEGD